VVRNSTYDTEYPDLSPRVLCFQGLIESWSIKIHTAEVRMSNYSTPVRIALYHLNTMLLQVLNGHIPNLIECVLTTTPLVVGARLTGYSSHLNRTVAML